MSPTNAILLALLSGFTFTLAWSALEDLQHRVIPHAAVLTVAALWIPFVLSGHGDWQAGLMAAAAFLIVGIFLFKFNMLGGGDAKLMAAVALWTGFEYALPFLFYTAIAGGFVALAVVIANRVRPQVAEGEGSAALTVPYGIAIAFGGIIAAWQAALTEVL